MKIRFAILMSLPLLFCQCEIRDKIERLTEVESEMEKEFRHDDIDLAMNWGEKSFIVITFYNFKFEDHRWSELKETALKAKDFALASDAELKELNYIVVIFADSTETKNSKEQVQIRIDRTDF